jgi:5-methylcytosine-specific restriction endonuclease McrA
MTDAFKWIKRHIEMATVKWPPRAEALRKASRISQLSDKRTKWERQCNHCKKWFKSNQIQLDHIVPKGKYQRESFLTWLDKCFPPVNGWQVLCKNCHLKKTKKEHQSGEYL